MSIKLEQITLAAEHVEAVTNFYDAVFGTALTADDTPMGVKIYVGTLAGIAFLVCPNTIAGVDARQNRQQFQFQVDDIDAVYALALAHGGRALQAVEAIDGVKVASVYDPDGNSIVLRQQL